MRVRALTIRIIRQFIRDKRTLGLIIVAPILILWLMSLVFSGDEYTPKIGIGELPSELINKIEKHGGEIENIRPNHSIQALNDGKIDAYIDMKGMVPSIILEGSDSTANKAVMTIVQKSLQDLQKSPLNVSPDVTYLHGSDEMAIFDSIGPYLIGYFVFFFVFLIAGVSFLRERTVGTLERLLATPIRRWEIVSGYVIGFGLFTIIQSAIIVWFSISILDIMIVGSFWYVLLVTLLLAITALTLGTLLSAYANNELQMIQFIPLVIVPQVFFSGLFNLETMAPWLQKISYIMPLTYGGDAMKEIMIRGSGWDAIALDVYVLAAFSICFMILNIFALKKHRRL
ncbi:ABC transporter permease [Ferdinandcohnia quinoae]|uniref:ABC transporter permease n=1 Tax=Fredinandcohnia quinoae TaxID=2918902 RepID=A0AAW5E4D9_9BACI|nr:ABC transporter permease [Fredinandcohnia sp. SECRCQ15]MCH1627812.1 ABC transporter permease [Fredinandcohnia sp. SECRCQ15]